MFYIISSSGAAYSSSAETPPSNLIQFWNAVINPDGIVKVDSVWALRNGAQWIGNLHSMFVRDCYVTLANTLLNDVTSISLILGIKGIGKTVFLNYLIVRIVEKFRALNQAIPDIVYTWKPDTIKRVRFSAASGVSVMGSSSPAPYYLSDSVDIADASLGERLLLEVTSHDPANYSKFSDRMVEGGAGAFEYHMPIWSVDELLVVNPSVSDVTFLFNVFGGCAGYFKPIGQMPDRVDDYIQRSAEWFFGPDTEFGLSSPLVWRGALHAIRTRIKKICGLPTNPDVVAVRNLFRDPHIQVPGTDYYAEGYVSRFLKFLAGCIKDDAEATLWNYLKDRVGVCGEGVAFESLGHKTLVATEQSFTATNLKGKKARSLKTCAVNFYQMPRRLFRRVEDIKDLEIGQYGISLSCNFSLVDAVIQPDILLQFTIARTHGKPCVRRGEVQGFAQAAERPYENAQADFRSEV